MSPNPRYTGGRSFEYKVRDWYYKMGAKLVMRAAGSHGPADLVVLWDKPLQEFGLSKVDLVQCKRDGKLPHQERIVMEHLADDTGASTWLAKSGGRGKDPVFELIRSGGT